MNTLQSWLVVGVPGLVVIAALFAGRSSLRAWLGYALLFALVVFFLVVPGDGLSAAAAGLVAVVLVGGGRGTHLDQERPEHHEDRRRYTTARELPGA